MTKLTRFGITLGCLTAVSLLAASCSGDGDASVASSGKGGSSTVGGAGDDAGADPGAGGSRSGSGGAARGGTSASATGGAASGAAGEPGSGAGGASEEPGTGGAGDRAGAGGSNEGPGTGGAAGAPPDGVGGTGPECSGAHPNVEGELRYCDPGDCYCTDPRDTCFPGEIAESCCEEAPDCGTDEEPGGVDCTGEHPIVGPPRTCNVGFCLCSDGEDVDVCLPADVAETCCPPGVDLGCVTDA